MDEDKRRISFHFHPRDFEHGLHAIEKADGDKKRCYLEGIASGSKEDQHGEKMTNKCIKSFMDQANSGDILLYADMHGFKATEDIGILKGAEILPDGDWHISSMLYDQSDGVDDRSVQVAAKLWKQINGLPPYKYPKQKGFSIEGFIPDESSIMMDQSGRRMMDDVALDGVVVVPRPAYKDSIANAVYKALGEVSPWAAQTFQTSFRSKLRDKLVVDEIQDTYFRRKYQIEDIFEEQIREIMCSEQPDKGALLEIAFEEYKSLMIELILQSEAVFQATIVDGPEVMMTKSRKAKLLTDISKSLSRLKELRGIK